MTPEDRALFERVVSDRRSLRGCFAAFLIQCVVGGAVLGGAVAFFAAVPMHGEPRRFVATGAIVGAALLGWLGWTVRPRPTIDTDPTSSDVELVHVHAFSAASDPDSDAFFFDVGEGQVFVVRGPHIRGPYHAGLFPNRYFTLVRHGTLTLLIDCHGEPLRAPMVKLGDASFEDGDVLARETLPFAWPA
jgi:hypothetical protein